MALYLGGKKVKEMYLGAVRVKEAYLGDEIAYQYDNVIPVLNITFPGGSPAYYQSDTAADITVTGTATDADSGVKAVTVNGVTATISGTSWSARLTGLATNTTHTITVKAEDNAGNVATITRSLRVEAYYQQAARIAGASVQSSLANTLASNAVCTAMANNASACAIMKSHYGAEMTSYVDQQSTWTNGLNTLCYRCGLKFYMIVNRVGATGFCNTTNGMNVYHKADDGGYAINISDLEVDLTGYTKAKIALYTKNTYGEGYTKVGFTSYVPGDTASDYDKYYKNQAVASIGTSTSWTMHNVDVQIDSAYKRLFIGMTLPLVNGYAQTGETYITSVAVIP